MPSFQGADMDFPEGLACQGHLGRSMSCLLRHRVEPEPRKHPGDARGSCSGEEGEAHRNVASPHLLLPADVCR